MHRNEAFDCKSGVLLQKQCDDLQNSLAKMRRSLYSKVPRYTAWHTNHAGLSR